MWWYKQLKENEMAKAVFTKKRVDEEENFIKRWLLNLMNELFGGLFCLTFKCVGVMIFLLIFIYLTCICISIDSFFLLLSPFRYFNMIKSIPTVLYNFDLFYRIVVLYCIFNARATLKAKKNCFFTVSEFMMK